MSGPAVDSHEDLPFQEDRVTRENRKLRLAVSGMEHDIFYLYVFLASQDLSEEACEFLESHSEDPVPFRRYM